MSTGAKVMVWFVVIVGALAIIGYASNASSNDQHSVTSNSAVDVNTSAPCLNADRASSLSNHAYEMLNSAQQAISNYDLDGAVRDTFAAADDYGQIGVLAEASAPGLAAIEYQVSSELQLAARDIQKGLFTPATRELVVSAKLINQGTKKLKQLMSSGSLTIC